MTFKEQVATVKTLLKGVFEVAAPAASDTAGADTLNDYTTDAGVVVKIDRLEPGGKVYMEDGTTPLVTGFTLADGTVVAVGTDGVISAVTLPTPLAADPLAAPVAPVVPAVPAYPAGFEERFTALENTVAELKAAKAQAFAEAESAKAEKERFAAALNGVVELVEKFAAEPADDPAQPPSGEPKQTKSQRREQILKTIAERKVKV